ncbi:3'(2'),5'-bisphosphate nucleotidase CysQ [Ekhidna sp.]|uniref:3'(2'),5'-bisphosphate nucleotidase CysQ n=1 Tax=Ekhidna sp. TaxID=2608089 RepID=UPI003C7E818B
MRREIIPYNPKLKELAKNLRQNMTLSEVLLWDELKQKKIKGYDFDRQKPLDEFIVDFYCKDLKLVIEVDGDSHDREEAFIADKKRQKKLEDLGVSFLRFDDLEIKKDITNVIRTIEYWIEENEEDLKKPTPTPPKRGLDSTKQKKSSSGKHSDHISRELFPSSEGLGVGHIDLESLLEVAKKAAHSAGAEILKIYESGDFSIEAKSDDSPLTLADKAAHNKIVSYLEETELPILSEEGRDISFEERKNWKYFWLVDPLDGTKEFIKKNGEFTVNIALIHNGEPILGVVYPPVLGEMFLGVKEKGAFKEKNGQVEKIYTTKKSLSESGLKVVASRSHMSPETEAFVSKLEKPEVVSKGSSLKFLLVASGEADVYPRFGPTMEWDTAAAHAVVSEAGGNVTLEDRETPLSYNKMNLLNPYFIVLPR